MVTFRGFLNQKGAFYDIPLATATNKTQEKEESLKSQKST